MKSISQRIEILIENIFKDKHYKYRNYMIIDNSISMVFQEDNHKSSIFEIGKIVLYKYEPDFKGQFIDENLVDDSVSVSFVVNNHYLFFPEYVKEMLYENNVLFKKDFFIDTPLPHNWSTSFFNIFTEKANKIIKNAVLSFDKDSENHSKFKYVRGLYLKEPIIEDESFIKSLINSFSNEYKLEYTPDDIKNNLIYCLLTVDIIDY